MHIVKTFCNLVQLDHDQNISTALFRHLYEKMENLQKALEPDLEDSEKFSLKKHGPIGILQKDDEDFSAIGLPSSLDEIMPEWVSRLEIEDETYYVLYVLADNDYCLQVYLPDKIVNETIRLWLSEQTLEEEREMQYSESIPPF